MVSFYFVCLDACLCLPVFVYKLHMSDACGGQKKVSGPLELE